MRKPPITPPKTALAITLLLWIAAVATAAEPPRAQQAQASPKPPVASPAFRADLEALFTTDSPHPPTDRFACGSSRSLIDYLQNLQRHVAARANNATTDNEAPPAQFQNRDGIWIVETDETMAIKDNIVDLEGMSLRYLPSAGGYDVSVIPLAYDDQVGTEIITDAPWKTYLEQPLTHFAFPFGGSSHSALWLGSDVAIRTAMGPEENADQAAPIAGLSDLADTRNLTPSFTLTGPVHSAPVAFDVAHTADADACMQVEIVGPGGFASALLKPFGAPYAGPYEMNWFYQTHGPGTYALRATELDDPAPGSVCNSGSPTGSLQSGSMRLVMQAQLSQQGQLDRFLTLEHLLKDTYDRLSPLYFPMGGNLGWTIYVDDRPDKFLVTWRTGPDPAAVTFYLDVQAALYPSGEVVFSYKTLQDVESGLPRLYPGLDGWHAGFTSAGSVADPIDPVDPALDIQSVNVAEDSASDLLSMTVGLGGQFPPSSPLNFDYWLVLEQGGNDVYSFSFQINAGGIGQLWQYAHSTDTWVLIGNPVLDGSEWKLLLSLADLPDLAPGPVTFEAVTYWIGLFQDNALLATAPAGGPSFFRDYTGEAPFTASGPIVEPFTIPMLLPGPVIDGLLEHTGWNPEQLDSVPIYQDYYTDIIFFLSAYGGGGNCGAGNIGLCDPSLPMAPSLQHMSKTNFGMNAAEPEGWLTVAQHELGHRWLHNVLIDEGSGPSNVLNPAGIHPAAYVDSRAAAPVLSPEDSGVMGGGYWIDNGDGTWSTPPHATFYGHPDYELYLMGLKDPPEVADWFYLANTIPPQPLQYFPATGITVGGQYRPVTIQMMIDAMGARFPTTATSKNDFFVSLVLMVRPGTEPSAEDWEFMLKVRDEWRDMFVLQTDNRGTLTTISPREVSPPGATPLKLSRNGDDLRFRFEDPGFGDQVRYNVYEGTLDGSFGDWSSLSCGEVASPAAEGKLGLEHAPSSWSQSHYYLVTMSNLEYEGGPGNTSAGTERDTGAQRCGGF